MTFADLAVGDRFTVTATGVPYVKRSLAGSDGIPGTAERTRQPGDPTTPSDFYGYGRYLTMLRADTPVERTK